MTAHRGNCIAKSLLVTLISLVLTGLSPAIQAATANAEDVRAIARLYSAAFDREPLEEGLNFWVKTFEDGSPIAAIAGRFNTAPEFTKKYGELNDRRYVEQLFRNVLGREGVRSGIDFWVGNLEDGSSRARVLARFADSPENITKTAATFADMRFVDGSWTFETIFTNNLVASSLEIESAFPRIGYPLELTVVIEAVEDTENVSVALFAIDKDRENIRQLVLDTATIERVDAGTNSYLFEVEVPTSFEIAGPYYIGVLVDAANFIGETNENDNETAIVTTLSPAESPNLLVEMLEPDRNAIVLDREAFDYDAQAELGVVNSDAGGTLSWRINGAVTPINVEAYATLKIVRSDNSSAYDVPLYLWNSNEARYMNAYGVDPDSGSFTEEEWLPIGSVGQIVTLDAEGSNNVSLSEFDPRSAHLDFYFPGGLANELEIALRNPGTLSDVLSSQPTEPPPDLSNAELQALAGFLRGATAGSLSSELCVEIRPANPAIEEDETLDNLACAPLALVLPPPKVGDTSDDPVLFESGFSTKWGGDTFGFGLDFSALATADNRGVILNALGEAPMQVFGLGVDFMAVEGRAQILPISDRDNPPPGQDPGFFLELEHLNQTLVFITVPDGTVGPLQLFFTKEFKGKDKIITIGPVPVKLKAALTGNIGAEYSIIFGPAAGNGVALEVAPFVNVKAGASAAVTVGIADVGVEGSITLVEEKFKVRSGSSINVQDDLSEIIYVPRLQVINELTGAKGALSVFVKVSVPTVEKCSWGIVTGLCPGLKTLKYPYTLAQWTAFRKVDELLDESRPMSVVTLPDGSPRYSQ